MSVGRWILTMYAPGVGIAALSELRPCKARRTRPGRLLDRLARPASVASAVVAPAVASYTAVLLSQTAAPAWHEAHPQLPFIFTGSAAVSAGGLAMVLTPVDEAGPARMFAWYGGVSELVAAKVMEQQLGLASEAYTTGRAHRLRMWSQRLTTAGLIGATLGGRRSRAVAVASGLALLAGSSLQRFGAMVLRASRAGPRPPSDRIAGWMPCRSLDAATGVVGRGGRNGDHDPMPYVAVGQDHTADVGLYVQRRSPGVSPRLTANLGPVLAAAKVTFWEE